MSKSINDRASVAALPDGVYRAADGTLVERIKANTTHWSLGQGVSISDEELIADHGGIREIYVSGGACTNAMDRVLDGVADMKRQIQLLAGLLQAAKPWIDFSCDPETGLPQRLASYLLKLEALGIEFIEPDHEPEESYA